MLKRLVASFLTAFGLLSLNATLALAEGTEDSMGFNWHPSICKLFFDVQKYPCDRVSMEAFGDGSSQIKLCSDSDCLMLLLSASQSYNMASEKKFQVDKLAWQTGNSITREWDTVMVCRLSHKAELACLGKLNDDRKILLYVN